MSCVVAVLLAVSVSGCDVLGRGAGGPSDAVRARAVAVADEVGGLDGVVTVSVAYDEVPDDDAADATAWRATLVVQVDTAHPDTADPSTAEPDVAVTSATYSSVGDRVREIVEHESSGPEWEVWLRDVAPDAAQGTAPSVSVQVLPQQDADAAVEAAFALAGTRGVEVVRVGNPDAWLVVSDASDIAAAVDAADRADVSLSSITTSDRSVTASPTADGFAGLPLDLVAELAATDAVTRVRVGPASAAYGADILVDVVVPDDDALDTVVTRLREATVARDADTPIAYVVSAGGRDAVGYVSELMPVGQPGVSSPTESWPADPDALACETEDLDVQVSGLDNVTGSWEMLLIAINISGRPCAVQSRPELTFIRSSGTPVEGVTVVPHTSYTVEPERVVVPAFGFVRSEVRLSPVPASTDPDPVVDMFVRWAPGAPARDMPVDAWNATARDGFSGWALDSIDLIPGTTVEVSPWVETIEGWNR